MNLHPSKQLNFLPTWIVLNKPTFKQITRIFINMNCSQELASHFTHTKDKNFNAFVGYVNMEIPLNQILLSFSTSAVVSHQVTFARKVRFFWVWNSVYNVLVPVMLSRYFLSPSEDGDSAPIRSIRWFSYNVRGLLVAVGRCNTQVWLSLIYVSGNLLDLRYLGSLWGMSYVRSHISKMHV